MSPRARAALAAALVSGVLVACGGSDVPSGTATDDTDVAGVVIERAEDAGSAGGDGGSAGAAARLPAGPATVGITWTRADGAWVGLGARTVTAGETADPLLLDVAADGSTAPRPDGCEVLLQAPADTGLLADGQLAVRVVVDEPDGASRAVELAPVRLDVQLAAGERHRAGVPGGSRLAGALDPVTAEASVVRCEGRFEPS